MQSYPQGYPQGYTQGQTLSQSYAQSYAQGLHYEQSINIKDSFKCATKDAAKATAKAITNGAPNDDDNDVLLRSCAHYSTLIVGPSFCGKTHLFLNNLQLIRLCDSEKHIHIITRSPDQYKDVRRASHRDLGLGI